MEFEAPKIEATPNEDMNNLPNICCQVPDHKAKKICAFCINEKCNEKIKFACFDCIFDKHSEHKMIKLNELNKILITKLKEYNSSKEEEFIINKLYSEKKKEISNLIDSLKQKIMKQIDEKFKLFKEDVFKQLFESNKKKENFDTIEKYSKIACSNAAPTSQNEIIELSQICLDIYKECKGNYKEKNINLNMDEVEKNCKNNLDNISQIFSKQFQTFSENQIELMNNYLEKNFLLLPDFMNQPKIFKWSNKEIGTNYGFLYSIDQTKITKTKKSGTITVIRGNDMLKNNYKYSIEFKVSLINGDDLDIGIGNEKAGKSAWLRNNFSCAMSTSGIYKEGNQIDKSFRLNNNDVVKMEINMKDKNFKGLVNGKEICNFNYKIDEIYIMAAIRNENNWVEVTSYDFSPA